jgi:hypothetical protein
MPCDLPRWLALCSQAAALVAPSAHADPSAEVAYGAIVQAPLDTLIAAADLAAERPARRRRPTWSP